MPIGNKDIVYGKWSPNWEDVIVLLDACLAMLTFMKHWKAKTSIEQSMENILRNIIPVFGLMPEVAG